MSYHHIMSSYNVIILCHHIASCHIISHHVTSYHHAISSVSTLVSIHVQLHSFVPFKFLSSFYVISLLSQQHDLIQQVNFIQHHLYHMQSGRVLLFPQRMRSYHRILFICAHYLWVKHAFHPYQHQQQHVMIEYLHPTCPRVMIDYPH